MMKLKKIFIKNSIFFLAIYNLYSPFNNIYSKEINESSNLNQTYINNSDKEDIEDIEIQNDVYILGPGDKIAITILGTDFEKGEYLILNDGSLSLPLAGDFYLNGKTIAQAKQEIIERLKEQILEPEVSIVLTNPRPISVFVLGEVNNPGIYNLSFDDNSNNLNTINSGVKGLPTLVSAIYSAGGITQNTNLKEVELLRLLPGNKNEYKKTRLDLIDLIFEGKKQNNPYLFDGDIIKFKEANKLYSEKINIISNNNLTPNTIEVSVIGEVKKPGIINIDKNTSLFQSILKAGGPENIRYSKANVDLFRVNRNGSASHKKFKIDFRKGISKDNPTLKNGDVIRVRRNLLAKSSDTLGAVTNPLQGVITLWSLFRIID